MFQYLPHPSSLIFFLRPLGGELERGGLIPLLCGWLLDLLLGDPAWLPHPVVWFGKAIAACEHRYNRGNHRKLKGALVALSLIILTFVLTALLNYTIYIIHYSLAIAFNVIAVFFCLAGHTLRREVRDVFCALERSLDDGRRQVARIVGRDTSELSAQEVRTAALETLAENLSDGVVAPLFWFALLGVPGMLTYKMINTLDSMIGYRTARYRDFGCWAAHIDDIANFIPARLTALLMIVSDHLQTLSPLSRKGESLATLDSCAESVDCKPEDAPPSREGVGLLSFVRFYGRNHASPNSGYPEAALAGILNCRFGGPHYYFGEIFDKPFIGDNERPLTTADLHTAIRVSRITEVIMLVLTAVITYFISW